MKVWISKYALTRGIFEIEAERCESIDPDMIAQVSVRYQTTYHGEGKEWHLTKEAAIERANRMRDDKIISLQKQMTKLNKLTFS